jgi:hypothetical protein
MPNKLLTYTAALCLLFFQSIVMSIDDMTPTRSKLPDLQADSQPTRAQKSARQLAKQRSAPQLPRNNPIEVTVISFTKFDPLPEYIPACEGCTAITVVFSVTCMRVDGCDGLSVMDFYVTYDSDYPTLFYGDEFPNPSLQGENYAGIIYGAQKEFSPASLEFEQTTVGELSFTVKPDASNFVLRYHRVGHEEYTALQLVEGPNE